MKKLGVNYFPNLTKDFSVNGNYFPFDHHFTVKETPTSKQQLPTLMAILVDLLGTDGAPPLVISCANLVREMNE